MAIKRRKTSRTVELTVERREFFVARKPQPIDWWCEGCGTHAAFVTSEEAAQSSGVSLRQLFQRIEQGEIHSIETNDGLLLICLTSLR
jgi:hydrogenase maturation factor HypF (carbamoyltransferase family)